MIKYRRFIIPTILVALFIIGSIASIQGQGSSSVELRGPNSVNICTNFSVELWVKHEDDSLGSMILNITWDPSQMEFVDIQFVDGWDAALGITDHYVFMQASAISDGDIFPPGTDHIFTLIFLCLDSGTSIIGFERAYLYRGIGGAGGSFTAELIEMEVTQGRSVGGIMTGANKLIILTPYIGFVGLVAIVTSAVIIMKRRKG
jgi:hypothetical protein